MSSDSATWSHKAPPRQIVGRHPDPTGQAAPRGGDQDKFLILQWQNIEVGGMRQARGTEQTDLTGPGTHSLQDILRDGGRGNGEGDVGVLGCERPHNRG